MTSLWLIAFGLMLAGLLVLGSGAGRRGAVFGWSIGAALAWLLVASGSVPMATPAWQVDVVASNGLQRVFATAAVDAARWHLAAGVLLLVLAAAGAATARTGLWSTRIAAGAWLALAALGAAGVLPAVVEHLVALPPGERLGTAGTAVADGGWSTQAVTAFAVAGLVLLGLERLAYADRTANMRASSIPWLGLGGALLLAAGLIWRLQATELGRTAHESGATMLALPFGLLVLGTQLVKRTGRDATERAPLDDAVHIGAVGALAYLLVSWGVAG
jgi:hypothetical protein